MNLENLREPLRQRFCAALRADPACSGRVCGETIDWMVEEAIRACEAVARKAGQQPVDTLIEEGKAAA